MAMVDEMLALMDRLELEFSPRISALLESGMRAMLVEVRQTRLVREPNPEFVRQLRKELEALWAEATAGGAALFLEEEFKNDVLTQIAADFANAYGNQHLQQITETTNRQIRDLMAGGLAAGQAVDVVYSDLFGKIPQMAAIRGLLVSRTEIHSATQFATWRLALRSSIPLVKVWNAVGDERTRDFGEVGKISAFNHRGMNGIRAAIASPFHVPRIIGGYENLMFPGDPTGSAGNIINCRCVQTYERAR